MFRTPSLVAAVLAGALGLLVAWAHEVERARSQGHGPELAGTRVDRCRTCHDKSREDPGGAHASAALGCASCHLGNPLAFGKERAHEGLEREPGALSTVGTTCASGGCHPREGARVSSSLMARVSGIVAVDRWVFGEIPSPESRETMQEVRASARPSPAELHLRKLCAGCHLGTRRANRDDAILGSGSGCAVCHVSPRKPGDPARAHPPIDSRVSDDRCLGCHSRSGRISLSYQGLAEVEPSQFTAGGSTPCRERTSLSDGRPACRHAPDVHRSAGLSCADCHLHTDLMGDGTARAHKEEQVEITCEACHGPAAAADETTWRGVEDPITRDLLRQRGDDRPPEERVRLGRRGTPLWNLRPSAAGWTLVTKLEGRKIRVAPTPADADHRMKGHARLSCSACHAVSAPTCSSCHMRYEAGKKQWDFARGQETPGAWIESSEGFAFSPPVLGVAADGRIVPAVPGMILDVAPKETASRPFAHRLFAPLEPHTTAKKARTCESCHLSSTALGLGTGTLDLDGPAPRFAPLTSISGDPSLAADAWTSLFPERPGVGTRVGFRSLDAAEQRRVLTVGTCLPCHSNAADPIWRDFRISLARLSGRSSCQFDRRTVAWIDVESPFRTRCFNCPPS